MFDPSIFATDRNRMPAREKECEKKICLSLIFFLSLTLSLSLCLSVSLFFPSLPFYNRLSVCITRVPMFSYLSVGLSVCLSICLPPSLFLSLCLSLCLSLSLSLSVSVSVSLPLSLCLSVCLSVCFSSPPPSLSLSDSLSLLCLTQFFYVL